MVRLTFQSFADSSCSVAILLFIEGRLLKRFALRRTGENSSRRRRWWWWKARSAQKGARSRTSRLDWRLRTAVGQDLLHNIPSIFGGELVWHQNHVVNPDSRNERVCLVDDCAIDRLPHGMLPLWVYQHGYNYRNTSANHICWSIFIAKATAGQSVQGCRRGSTRKEP
jgi:hypothetical protein